MKLFFVIIFSILFSESNAQSNGDSVMIHKDPRVDLLIKKQIQINDETTRDSRRTMPGYRIQVMNSTDRDKVFAAKTKIYQELPELKLYLLYQSPNYRLKAGNFKTAEDADVYMKKLAALFPSELYVVRDMIEIKPGKEDSVN